MGHREQLLAAARRSLVERGYARTRARDLVEMSGTNLASIGYHFGSKEQLLAEALDGILAEYTDKVLVLAESVGTVGSPAAAVEAAWIAMTELQDEYRPVLIAFVEALAQAERSEPLRQRLATGYEDMRVRITEAVMTLQPDAPEALARAVASFFIAVSDGYMVQWLLDRDSTPDGRSLLEAARLTLGA